MVGGEAEEGMNGREAGVARGNAASSIVLEVIEEAAHEHCVEILDVHVGRHAETIAYPSVVEGP